ncbi:MAG TPA: hypothetical protein VM099_08270 [Gemmatimonadaceae bacterium]|nr:hypothetical protein [Gemmatimonadaceae bacterium]
MPRKLSLVLLTGAVFAASTQTAAQLSTPLDSAALSTFRWRAIGPAVMGGRITDVEADPRNPGTFYVVAATGGIWKTINAGTTFFPIFDKESVISMGDLAIAPSNPDILYAGTGEEDSRNSLSPGGGLYKSTDGGRTWKLSGLVETQQIGRIIVDPTDPNIVYVAALGHTWNSNPERGLYKTTDGGTTWKLSKFISDKAGFVDIAMDPKDHNTLFASSWERVRGPYFLKSGGPGSGLWKTTDAGATWSEVKGGGFPETTKGRIGLAIAPSDSKVIYALTEADTLPKALPKGMLPDTARAQRTNSGLYRSTDGGATWTLMRRNEGDARPFYYSQVRVDPKNPNRVYWMSSVFRFSDDGGKTERRGALSLHTDWHAMWIDPNNPDHFILGEDGGIGQTYDRGGTYDFINTIPLGQFYDVSFDMQRPYTVCGGLQDNGSWCGPSRTRGRFGPTNADWQNVGGGDGFYTAQDPNDPNIVYSESQGGNASRLNLATNARTSIMRGGGRPPGAIFEDSLIIARGDTTQPLTPQLSSRLAQVRARAAADSAKRYRFNWEAPLFLSAHAATTVYMAGNRVLKSTDRGDHFFPISPDLSTKDSARIIVSTRTTGGVTRDPTGAETYGTITSLAESPIRPGILWAGTDDGNVWFTTNDGGTWTDITKKFPGVPPRTWVSKIEPSHFDTATVYVSFDGHRDNNFKPYLFVSNDFGQTFKSIVNNLPSDGIGFVHVVREDPYNRNLLFVGTDVAAYVSTNRGEAWQRFMTGLPTVPVHDLKIHPRDREIIAGTHGRSIYVADIAPLEQMADSTMRTSAWFFQPVTAYEYAVGFTQRWEGNKTFVADNPPFGAALIYRLSSGDSRRDTTRIVITNVKGDVVRSLTGPGGPGIHRVTWDLRGTLRPLGPSALRDSLAGARLRRMREDSVRAARGDTTASGDTATRGRRGGGPGFGGRVPTGEFNMRPAEAAPGAPPQGGGGGGFGGQRQGPMVPEGDYLVTITANGQTMKRVLHVDRVSEIPEEPFGADDEEDDGGDP